MLNDVRLTTLDNGLRIISAPSPHTESVSVGIWIGVGGRHEPAHLSGISHFLEHMVFKGTRKYSARAISNAIEGRGGDLNAFTQEENTCLFARLPHEQMPRAVEVLSEMFRHARLSPIEIERERAVILEEIRMIRDQPQQWAQDLSMQALWSRHALGRPLAGSAQTVPAIDLATLHAYRDRYYVPVNTVVAFAGNVSHEACVAQVYRRLGDMPPGRRPQRRSIRPNTPQTPYLFTQRDVEQLQLVLAWRFFGRHDPRRFELRMLNALTGENMSSRLFQLLRERHGLTYSIHSHYQLFADTGMFSISAGIDRDKLVKVLQLIQRERLRLCSQLPGRAEMARARDYLLGQFRLGMESPGNQMQWIGENLLNDNHWVDPETVIDGICAVTPESVTELADALFTPARLSMVLVAPPREAHDCENLRHLVA